MSIVSALLLGAPPPTFQAVGTRLHIADDRKKFLPKPGTVITQNMNCVERRQSVLVRAERDVVDSINDGCHSMKMIMNSCEISESQAKRIVAKLRKENRVECRVLNEFGRFHLSEAKHA